MEPTNDANRPVSGDAIQPAPSAAAAEEAAPAPPLSLTGRLLSNLPYLVILVFVVWLLQRGGFDFLFRAVLVGLGLGFIIFVHELGHFLAAKWCDVHVQTFSIGFGPSIPGCSFVRGETTYKIAILPLGGYVNMVGEGPEADEDESYPRSFKNKSVPQRMLIISAGVVMNMLFAAVVFVGVYLTVGEDRPVATVWATDPGSPAWRAGVRPGWKVAAIDGYETPYFDDLKSTVALSGRDQKIAFRFEALPGAPAVPSEPVVLVPHRDANNQAPAIGLNPASRLKLVPARFKSQYSLPVSYFSPAAAARSFDLTADDVPLKCTDPAKPGEPKDLPRAGAWEEVCARLRKASSDDEFVVRVRGKDGKERDVRGHTGFDFGDAVVGTSDPARGDHPFAVSALPVDENHPEEPMADPFAYRQRLRALAGRPFVVQVKRDKNSAESGVALVLVPPAFHVTFGMRMRMGEVAALRDGAPATAAQDEEKRMQPGDKIQLSVQIEKDGRKHPECGVLVRYAGGPWEQLKEIKEPGDVIDPLKLPDELRRKIHGDKQRDPAKGKWEVKFVVERKDGHNPQAKKELDPMAWDDSWRLGDDLPLSPASPLSIPQLGIAYRVDSMVADVTKDTPADKAGILPGDEIRSIRFRSGGKVPALAEASWSSWFEMKNEVKGGYDQWAYYFRQVQYSDYKDVEVEVYRNNVRLKPEEGKTWEMQAEADDKWPLTDRGIFLTPDLRRQKAGGLFEAVKMGLDKTKRTTLEIYSALMSLVSGRIARKNMGGPVAIASGAFMAAQDPTVFLLLMAAISINLAVVNFLPIPILDGGHMVFLIYEGVRGKPPPESVRVVATYLGLLMILALMVFVFYNDLARLGLFDWLRVFRK